MGNEPMGHRIAWILLAGVLGMVNRSEAASPVALCDAFQPEAFAEPESTLWPGYFWLWNAPLDPDVLKSQLRDMAEHGARSVCMLPMPQAFRPDSTNNGLDPDYLTREYFERVRMAVEEASALGMNWWLYDEGGWPSGSACGKVAEGYPDWVQQRLARETVRTSEPFTVPADALALVVEHPERRVLCPGSVWTPSTPESVATLYRIRLGGYADLLNPEVTARFITLTHEAYRNAVGGFFGDTIRFTFTDEPNAPNLDPPHTIPWTPGMDLAYKQVAGHDLTDALPRLFTIPGPDVSPDVARTRIAFYDLWTQRFRSNYFEPIAHWARHYGLASGGHLNGEDETVNAVRHGFGHALRQLRAMEVPGVDLIWRQLFPGREGQHFFPKYASTAAHQNGTRYAFTESFCVFGNGLTPAQMKWLVDYQYIRGLNLLVGGCYPLSTQDHHMTGERPHFGQANPCWNHLTGFHAYTARLGYALSIGAPKVATALYYPVRDLWALGADATDAVATHDRLAAELLARQRDFDLIDDDLISDAATRIEGRELVAGAMRYSSVVCGAVRWMQPETRAVLEEFAKAGGSVLCLGDPPGTNGTPGTNAAGFVVLADASALAEHAPPTAVITPASAGIRAAARVTRDGEILALFNESGAAYDGKVAAAASAICRLEAATGRMVMSGPEVRLAPGEMAILLLCDAPGPGTEAALRPTADVLDLTESIVALPLRRFIVGARDFEIAVPSPGSEWFNSEPLGPVPFAKAASWNTWLTADYSGEVEYEAVFEIPAEWKGCEFRLETGPVEYAATVFLDDEKVGYLLWSPWMVDLPPRAPGPHRLVIRVANTLANELTSERVQRLWAEKHGPGWPSPYHERALEFERESRGGGMLGPVRVRRLERAPAR